MAKNLLEKIHYYKSRMIFKHISSFIVGGVNIIDIGSGVGTLTNIIRGLGKDVVPLDVGGYRWPRVNNPVLYDGVVIPFKDKTFDTALLITVMHHTANPEAILKEAGRVAKEVVIMETSYKNTSHKLLTVVFDTLVNLQKSWYWNSYHSDKEWREIFSNNGFIVKGTEKYWDFYNFGIPLFHITYHLVVSDKTD